MVYTVSDDVVVKKNDVSADLDQVYSGDKGTITLQYGVITKIDVDSIKTTKEGTIKSITLTSTGSTIIISVDGTEYEYDVTNDCKITVNGEDASLYDFRVGDAVSIILDSNAVTTIRATSTQSTSGSIIGVVESINSSYGFINVKVDGSSIAQTIFCKDTTTKFYNFETGATLKMANISVGDTVQVTGSISNGAFVAKAVYVTEIAQ